MFRVRRIEAAWTALLFAIVVLGLLTSEGEPVCEGPFVPRVADSLPPQCPSPVEVFVELLPLVVVAWVVGLGVILGIRGLKRARLSARGSSNY